MLKIQNLCKNFGTRVAVDNLILEIRTGEIFGLLGPNGAGKTTLVRMLTLLAKVTSGTAIIDGHDILTDADAVKELIGVVPQNLNLDYDLTGWENLQLQARMHHITDHKECVDRIVNILDFVELKDRAHDICRTYSGGMKRRLMIGMALVHKPKILFLDEPTVGLDPQVRRKMWDLIRSMNTNGMTVLLTTHYIEEAEQLCDRVGIMELGKLIALETPEGLLEKVGKFVVEWMKDENSNSKVFATREEAMAFAAELEENATIRAANLEDVFIELTGRKVNE
ncbi:MAG: ABC transporter ATP-binding protein [Acidaminococcaceae bacterium]|nr:ABC transporter ATP-binding protein [Acidaminococcaceae bacterium]